MTLIRTDNSQYTPSINTAFASGQYFFPSSQQTASTSPTLGNGALRLSPFALSSRVVISRVGGEITAIGDVGSKLRIGIYADNGQNYPGALLLDAGQIAGDSATVQEITLGSSLMLNPGIYWAGGAVQAVTTTQPTVRTLSGGSSQGMLIAMTAIPGAGAAAAGYSTGGVTGALPGTYPALGTANAGGTSPRLFLRVA